jgi:hypothetical protein
MENKRPHNCTDITSKLLDNKYLKIITRGLLIACIVYYRMEHSTKIFFKKNVKYVLKASIVLGIRVKILFHVLSDFTVLMELVMTGSLVLKEHTASQLVSRNNPVRSNLREQQRIGVSTCHDTLFPLV